VAKKATVSAPGRICLFGEHQDFLGLAVIACPIDMAIEIRASGRSDTRFVVDMPDIGARDEFDGAHESAYRSDRDYLRSATNTLLRAGLRVTHGLDCAIHGTIPINAGAASSSALIVAWISLLLATQEHDLPGSREDIARYAHRAEVLEFCEGGGMMDHYTSSVGGLLHIDCCEPIRVTHLSAHLEGFVLGDSRVPKDTVGVLKASRDAVRTGIRALQERIPDFCFKTTSMGEAEPYFDLMDPDVRRRVRANFIDRDLCGEAKRMLSHRDFNPGRLGAMLYEHHVQLRDGVGVSHRKLDAMLDAAMEAGALGGKLNGSGCGGTMFAFAPGREEQVREAIERAGGAAHIIRPRGGVSVLAEDTAGDALLDRRPASDPVRTPGLSATTSY
jgi:galactokinase